MLSKKRKRHQQKQQNANLFASIANVTEAAERTGKQKKIKVVRF